MSCFIGDCPVKRIRQPKSRMPVISAYRRFTDRGRNGWKSPVVATVMRSYRMDSCHSGFYPSFLTRISARLPPIHHPDSTDVPWTLAAEAGYRKAYLSCGFATSVLDSLPLYSISLSIGYLSVSCVALLCALEFTLTQHSTSRTIPSATCSFHVIEAQWA